MTKTFPLINNVVSMIEFDYPTNFNSLPCYIVAAKVPMIICDRSTFRNTKSHLTESHIS